MEKLDSYKVNLKGMPSDTVSYQWRVDDDFFSAVQGPELQHGTLDVALRVKRTSGAYELVFQLDGTVKVQCDRCLELMDLPIQAQRELRVRLGDEFSDDGELVTIPYEDGTFNVAWNLYEMIALEIPIRHVHSDGPCAREDDEDEMEDDSQKPTDSRWDELKKLMTNK